MQDAKSSETLNSKTVLSVTFVSCWIWKQIVNPPFCRQQQSYLAKFLKYSRTAVNLISVEGQAPSQTLKRHVSHKIIRELNTSQPSYISYLVYRIL